MPTLHWIGKEAVVNHHHDVPFHLLRDVPSLACGEPGSGNLIVQGDNLTALKALLPYYAGQVKCIYIDPPYNTGNEGWAYNDNVNSPIIREWLGKTVGKEAEDLSRHDKWLCMIYPRLALLRQFLREDGVIFVSLDDNEIQNLRAVLDEVFGGANFLATIIWQKRTSPDARLHLGPAHDYVVAYARNLPVLKPTLHKIGLSGERIKAFKNPDNDVRGPWASVDMTGQTGHATPDQFYEIITPSGKLLKPPQGRCWAMAKKTADSLISDNRVWFGKTGDARPRLKKFLSETEGMTSWTWWPNTEVGHNQEGTKELNEVMQRADLFENPKPTRLIKRILELATSKDSLILDSFAGSGTTGHTVLQLNKQDGGSRRCILVEMESRISREITAERVRRAALGYTNAKGEKVEGLGGGFRFCELGEPIYDEVGRLRPAVKFADLARHVYFFETGESMPRERVHTTPLLGTHRNRAVCLLYNGILRDKSPEGGNALTHATLALLREECSGRGIEWIVVYGTSRRLSPARLAREGITFKQIPYTLRTT